MATLTNTTQSNNATTAIGGAVPGANDTVRYREFNQDFTAGLSLDTNAIDLLEITPGCGSNFGWDRTTAASPGSLKVKTSAAGVVRFNGSGNYLYLASTSAATVLYQFDFQPVSAGTAVLGAMDNEYCNQRGGVVLVTDVCDCARLSCGAGVANVAYSGSLTMTLAVACGSGMLETNRPTTTLTSAGSGTLRAMLVTATPTTANLLGGTMELRVASVGTLNAYGGVLDLSKAPEPIEFTNTNWFGPVTVLLPKTGPQPTWGTTVTNHQPDLRYV